MTKMGDGGSAWTVSANGRTYRLAVRAKQVGPARDARVGGTGQKIYERGNDYADAGKKNVTVLSTSIAPIVATDLHRREDSATDADDAPVRVQVTFNRTKRIEEADTRGSNLLSMLGLRANKLTDFTQTVEFEFTLEEVNNRAATASDAVRAATGFAKRNSETAR